MACIPVSLYTVAKNKAHGSSPFQWAQASELNRLGDSQTHSAFSVNSNGRFDTFSLGSLSFLPFCSSFLSPYSLSCSLPPFFPSQKVWLHTNQGSPSGCQYCLAECQLCTHTVHTHNTHTIGSGCHLIGLDWYGLIKCLCGRRDGERANLENHIQELLI